MYFMREYPIPKDQMDDIEAVVEAGNVEEVRRIINAAFFDGYLCSVGLSLDVKRLTPSHLYVIGVDAALSNKKIRLGWQVL